MNYKKCPICKERIVGDKNNMIIHVEKEHEDIIPENQKTGEFIYLKEHGNQPRKCMICKKPTEWNDRTNKYNAFCCDECKQAYVKLAKDRMRKVYGKECILDEPDVQKKMLANRSISGKYYHSDGGILTYTGTFEEDFCKMMDTFLQFPSTDIIMPSPHVYEYIYDGKKHFYFPDVFIPSLMLEIEIKDGGDNPNMHHKIQDVDKAKERLKDSVMLEQRDFHYIKIENKDYGLFFNLVERLVNEELTDREQREKIKVVPEIKELLREQFQSTEILKESLMDLKFYHGSEIKLQGNKILANSLNMGNRLEDPKWVVYMWRTKEYAYSWAVYRALYRSANNLGIRPHDCIYLDLFREGLGVLVKKDMYNELRSETINSKTYVYTITSKLTNVRIGHSAFLPEFTSTEDCNIIECEEIEISEDFFDNKVGIATQRQLKDIEKLSKGDLVARLKSPRGIITLLMYGDEYIFPILKRIRRKQNNGEIKVGDNLVVIVEDIIKEMESEQKA